MIPYIGDVNVNVNGIPVVGVGAVPNVGDVNVVGVNYINVQ